MKIVLIVGASLVLFLGLFVLWLSNEPPSETVNDVAVQSGNERRTPPAAELEVGSAAGDPAAEVATVPSTQSASAPAPAPDEDTGFRPITQIGPTTAQTGSEPIAQSDVAAERPSSWEGPQTAGTSSSPPANRPPEVQPGAGTTASEPLPQETPARSSTGSSEAPPADTVEIVAPEERTEIVDRAAAKPPAAKPSRDVAAAAQDRARSPDRQRVPVRPPAPPGRYETITRATARSRPRDAAPIVDRINRGTFLNVTGSEGDWLVVYSKRKNITVFVKRDEAMLTRDRSAQNKTVPEAAWPDVERQILQAFARNNITGVRVTFIADTAYLKGTVKTENERERAEIFARSVLAVKHVFNGIRVE